MANNAKRRTREVHLDWGMALYRNDQGAHCQTSVHCSLTLYPSLKITCIRGHTNFTIVGGIVKRCTSPLTVTLAVDGQFARLPVSGQVARIQLWLTSTCTWCHAHHCVYIVHMYAPQEIQLCNTFHFLLADMVSYCVSFDWIINNIKVSEKLMLINTLQ